MPDRPLLGDVQYRRRQKIMLALEEAKNKGQLSKEMLHLFKTPRPYEELYSLKEDTYELNNLAMDPSFETIKAKMAKELDNFLKEVGDKHEIDEFAMVKNWWGG